MAAAAHHEPKAGSALGTHPMMTRDKSKLSEKSSLRSRITTDQRIRVPSSSSADAAVHAGAGVAMTVARRELPLHSPCFNVIRKKELAFVDKTAAIAEMLNFSTPVRVFFTRPRKFGKSLTISIAEHILAAGSLPPGVDPSPGYQPVDIEKMFGGLAVYDQLTQPLSEPYDQLNVAHFVIRLDLGAVSTGVELKSQIIDSLAGIAGEHFGVAAKTEIRSYTLVASALKAVIRMVPRGVPVAMLLDEYDAAIMCDVTKQRWDDADAGLRALRDLLMVIKDGDCSSRVHRCLVTGVARVAYSSLFSAVNNFSDLTHFEPMSRVAGFTEEEIRRTFAPELVALGDRLPAEKRGDASAEDAAITELKTWYNGYSFDGVHTCYAPFHVMRALQAGACEPNDCLASAASVGAYVPTLSPPVFVRQLMEELAASGTVQLQVAKELDIADLAASDPHIRVIPMLLQTGLLTLVPAPLTDEEAACPSPPAKILCAPPNALARKQLAQLMFERGSPRHVAAEQLSDAIRARDRLAFSGLLRQHIFDLPKLKAELDGKVAEGVQIKATERLFHTYWLGILKMAVPADVAVVSSEVSGLAGRADVIIGFRQVREVWVLEFGMTTGDMGVKVAAKLKQAAAYAQRCAYTHTVHCLAVVVSAKPGISASRDPEAAQQMCVTEWGHSLCSTAAASWSE